MSTPSIFYFMRGLLHRVITINHPCHEVYKEGVFRQIQEEFGKIKVLITKSTDARRILKPQSTPS